MARFIQHLAPILEQRLADSPIAGFTGDFNLNFYRSGLKLVFEYGRLKGVEPWRALIYGEKGEVARESLVIGQLSRNAENRRT